MCEEREGSECVRRERRNMLGEREGVSEVREKGAREENEGECMRRVGGVRKERENSECEERYDIRNTVGEECVRRDIRIR